MEDEEDVTEIEVETGEDVTDERGTNPGIIYYFLLIFLFLLFEALIRNVPHKVHSSKFGYLNWEIK